MSFPVFIDLKDSFETENITNIYMSGSWNNWTVSHPVSDILYLTLNPGIHQFKCYRIDDGKKDWFLLPYSSVPTVMDSTSNEINNALIIKDNGDNTYTVEYDSYKFIGKNRDRIMGQLYINDNLSYEGEMPSGNMTIYDDSGDVYYEGETLSFLRHGHGVCWEEGNYIGDWIYDSRCGQGTLTLDDGTVYEGEWKDNIFNGEGKLKTPNGSEYQGTFKDGQKCGKGTLKMADGTIYEGDWSNNLFHGNGKLINKHGEYNGGFVNGLKQGYGRMDYTEGDSYFGQWVNSRWFGEGIHRTVNFYVYKGNFVDGVATGNFKKFVRIQDTEKLIYEGALWHGLYHGKGVLYVDDRKFDGLFNYDEFVKGILWNNGVKESEGLYREKKLYDGKVYVNGNCVYEGEINNGVRNGFGMEYAKSGLVVYKGRWKDNKKEEPSVLIVLLVWILVFFMAGRLFGVV